MVSFLRRLSCLQETSRAAQKCEEVITFHKRLKLTKEGKVTTKGNEKETGYRYILIGMQRDFYFPISNSSVTTNLTTFSMVSVS